MIRRLLLLSAALLCATALPLATTGPAMALGYPLSAVVSANPADYTPNVMDTSAGDGTVLAILPLGNRVYVGGVFHTVRNAGSTTNITRNYLFAYDRTTGQVLGFAPAVNGIVETIAPAPDGTSIIIGGDFTTVQGASQRSLAMINAAGARVSSFTASTNGSVNKVLVRGTRLVAGGRFSKAGSATRSNLAVFNATTGAVDGRFSIGVAQGRTLSDGTATAASVYEMDADATGAHLVVVGNFRQVGGQKRMQIAMINLASNALSSWFTNRYPNDFSGALVYQCRQTFYTQLHDVEFSPDGSYFVAVGTGGAPDYNQTSLCDTAARFETNGTVGTSGAHETWHNCTGGDTLYSVAVTTAAVYVGGHERWLDNCGGQDTSVAGSFAAPGVGAIDPTTGKAIRTWNPGRTRGLGAEELVAQSDGLYIGSDTEQLGGEYHARLGLFPAR